MSRLGRCPGESPLGRKAPGPYAWRHTSRVVVDTMAEPIPDAGPDPGVAGRESLHARGERAWQDAQATWARAQATRANQTEAPKGFSKELLTVSALARVRAQFATMAVIEQAKGVLIAQQGCSPEEAFDLLRRASQRSNVPVRDLAAQIVHNAQNHRRPASKTTTASATPTG
jgi:ANTAR domain